MRALNTTSLAVITTVAVLGIIALAVIGHPIPDVLAAIALGGLGGATGATVPQTVRTDIIHSTSPAAASNASTAGLTVVAPPAPDPAP